ncbi:hypothetical protein DICPUDRAFT_75271 [Dictyostelium purpureum]|uniref:Endonuclease/exonuclease/phosphatase domain-containing protein n=1 Tax=Dictyostelium purpureum TaxID=5786 RepID=F0ZA66_DICPU|nr:uncharacterized protein DICPUDRAFT_75271 [Dictyostelium purpureum]EGC39182.1 hypothetical protein DICPUDRAFT_75271 [Dictyostelium purpureum]|eukprot:XP_003284328.1 hypothetical protein DICPUDRAFT_75271 [Dictyostelium purpureum]
MKTSNLRVCSYNIRYDNIDDKQNQWVYRKMLVFSNIAFLKPHIIGFQECLFNQINDLKEGLLEKFGMNYDYIGLGRDDGEKNGEFSPIFYNTDKVELVHSHQFWISETPYKPGTKSWKTACPRIVTWGLFKFKKSNKLFYFLNTHLDHLSESARYEGTLMIKSFIATLKPQIPLVLVGDFNSNEYQKPIINIVSSSIDIIKSKKYLELLEIPLRDDILFQTLFNARNVANCKIGPDHTFTGFNGQFTENIDYIFINQQFKTTSFIVFNNHPSKITKSSTIASDHFPIIADLQFL